MNKKNSSKNKDGNTTGETPLTTDQLIEAELLKEQILGSLIGVFGALFFYRASCEELQELYNENTDNNEVFIDSNITFLSSAQFFLISQLIFTKVSFQIYNLLARKNFEENIYEDLTPEIKINISCILNSLGNIYFLNAIQDFIARGDTEPIIGD